MVNYESAPNRQAAQRSDQIMRLWTRRPVPCPLRATSASGRAF